MCQVFYLATAYQAAACAFVIQLSKCNSCFKHHMCERGHIWSQCDTERYADLKLHINIRLSVSLIHTLQNIDRLGLLSWIIKSTQPIRLNQWTQTLLTSADIWYMCHFVLYINIGLARDMFFSLASLPNYRQRHFAKSEIDGKGTRYKSLTGTYNCAKRYRKS